MPPRWARLIIPARGGVEAGLERAKVGEEGWGGQVEAEVEDLGGGGDNLSRREGGHLRDLLCRREGGHPFSQVLTRLLREPWGSRTSDPS